MLGGGHVAAGEFFGPMRLYELAKKFLLFFVLKYHVHRKTLLVGVRDCALHAARTCRTRHPLHDKIRNDTGRNDLWRDERALCGNKRPLRHRSADTTRSAP